MGIKITKYREFRKNSLLGFCDILMTKIGLEIRDAAVHEKDGKLWVGLPAKPYEKKDGSKDYSYIIKFVDKSKYGQFQRLALKALQQHIKKEKIRDTGEDDIPF